MRLNWIRLFEQVGNNELQEQFIEREHSFVKKGKTYKFCKVCKRWVQKQDWYRFCKEGMHEYSIELNVKEPFKKIEDVKKLSETQI